MCCVLATTVTSAAEVIYNVSAEDAWNPRYVATLWNNKAGKHCTMLLQGPKDRLIINKPDFRLSLLGLHCHWSEHFRQKCPILE